MDSSGYSRGYECNLSVFHSRYSRCHGWISLFVCIFGSIANVLNIVVLTRREMRSPTNTILTGLAVADLLVMIDYIPYAFHFYLYRRSRRDTYTFGWTMFVFFHSNFAQVCHTISICLTLILAVWRYVAVARPQQTREWCSYRRTIYAIIVAYLFCPLLCIPLYITTEVREEVELLNSNGMSVKHDRNGSFVGNATYTTLYFVQLTETAENHHILAELNIWIYSVVIKLFPCVVLTIVSLKLLQVLLEAKRRRRKLRNIQEESLERKMAGRRLDKERQTDRTTMMLLAVLLLFLLTELPQGILGLLSVLLGQGFFRTCYLMLGDVIDMLTLVNSAINFILYCTMSRQFRETFSELFCKGLKGSRKSGAEQRTFRENNGNTAANHTVTQVTQV